MRNNQLRSVQQVLFYLQLDQECGRVLEDCHACWIFDFCVFSYLYLLMQESKTQYDAENRGRKENRLSPYTTVVQISVCHT